MHRFVACLVLCAALPVLADTSRATQSIAGTWRADALVTIDQNRAAIVADIVSGFRGDLALAFPGGEADEAGRLSAQLSSLRADRLLVASLATSYGSLKAVLRDAQFEQARESLRAREKALGDPNKDLAYIPVVPCRLIDTRGFGAPIQGGAFSGNARRNYIPQGQCGLPTANVSAILVSFTTQNLSPNSGGYLAILAPAAPVTASVDVFNLGAEWSASNTVVKTGPAAEFDVFVAVANAHVVIDILGYFSPPQGGYVSSLTAGAGLTGGTITSSGTLGLAATQLLPVTPCTTGQLVKWTGTAWACNFDVDTNTTYTPGTGLSLGGTQFQVATGFQLPQGCTVNQVASSNGAGGWTCRTLPAPATTAFTNIYSFSAGIPATGATLDFISGPTPVTLAQVSRITSVITASLAVSAGSSSMQLDTCYRLVGGGAPLSLTGGAYIQLGVTTTRQPYTLAASRPSLNPGNYEVGLCAKNVTAAISVTDAFMGWLMVE